ncbi:MAG: FAD-dependent monooxygenase, partial [Steroidobacteraceae bacterium]|nr:FAD-dependent monooxygenase [Steroidobacteraceae bacterium]
MKAPLRVAIVGAGLGGLACAAVLQRRGHRVRLFEQAPQLAEIGAGIQLSANANKVLAAVGALGAIAERAVVPKEYQFRLHSSGEVLQRIPLGDSHRQRFGAPYFLAHRADVHAALVAVVTAHDPQALVVDSQVRSVEERDDAAIVWCANGYAESADLVIGADGIHSVVRAR